MTAATPRNATSLLGPVLFFGRPIALAGLVLYVSVKYDAWRDPVALALGVLVVALWAGWRANLIAFRRQLRERLGPGFGNAGAGGPPGEEATSRRHAA
jgi:hypothetical protein